jgi:hypothetical protein
MKRSVAVVVAMLMASGIAASELEQPEVVESKSMIRQKPRELGSKEVRVDLSSASLGDCVAAHPAPKSEKSEKSVADSDSIELEGDRAARDCTNSVQISVEAGPKASASKIRVKSVELFDAGKSVAKLTASAPMSWSDAGQYETWNEKAAAGKTLSASYTLSQPDWSKIPDYKSKTFRIRVVVTVAGTEKSLERDVSLEGDIDLPPDVVT